MRSVRHLPQRRPRRSLVRAARACSVCRAVFSRLKQRRNRCSYVKHALMCRRGGARLKGIDDSHAVIVSTMGQVFALDGLATHLLHGDEDGGVPVGDLESLLRVDCREHQLARDRPDGKRGERLKDGPTLRRVSSRDAAWSPRRNKTPGAPVRKSRFRVAITTDERRFASPDRRRRSMPHTRAHWCQ